MNQPEIYEMRAMVILFPIHTKNMMRCKSEVPLREKVELAARMQHCWSDNQVSCTADFDPDNESRQVPAILSDYERRLKCIVSLPSRTHGYKQPPYEQIAMEEYERMLSSLKPLRGAVSHEKDYEARFRDGRPCKPV